MNQPLSINIYDMSLNEKGYDLLFQCNVCLKDKYLCIDSACMSTDKGNRTI